MTIDKRNCMQTGNYARSLGKTQGRAKAQGRAKGKGVGAIRTSPHVLKEEKSSPKRVK